MLSCIEGGLYILEMFKKLFFKGGNEKHNFETMIGGLDKVLARNNVILSSDDSCKQGEFRGNPMERLSFKEKISLLPILFKNITEVKKSYRNLDFVSTKNHITDIELNKIIEKGKDLGIISMGFTKIEQEDIFEGYGILYPYAIVFSIEMDKDKINTAPSFDALETVQDTYAETAIVANRLTKFIKEMGFAAHAGPGLGGLTIYPVLAYKAGIGAFGRHGLIITPEAGPRQRLAVVYTNIENLPFSNENPHRWIEEFCSKCGKCIKKCPSCAIHEKPIKTNGNHIEYIDNDLCVDYFSKNYGCSVCIKECPFNQLGYDKIKNSFLR